MALDLRSLPNDSRLLTVREVAGVLHVNRSTVYRLIRAGQIRAVLVGSATRIRPSEVDRYLTQQPDVTEPREEP